MNTTALNRVTGHRTSVTRHTSDPRETLQHRFRTLLHQKRGTRHFGIRSTKSRDTLHQGQFRQDTALPVIRLKVGADVSSGRSAWLPSLNRSVGVSVNVNGKSIIAQHCVAGPAVVLPRRGGRRGRRLSSWSSPVSAIWSVDQLASTVARNRSARDLLCSSAGRPRVGGQKPRLSRRRGRAGAEQDGTGREMFRCR